MSHQAQGITIPIIDGDGNMAMTQQPRLGTEKYFYVPNLCDPTTWHTNTTEHPQLILTNPLLDLLSFESGITNWIDVNHGKIFREDDIPNKAALTPLIEVDSGGGFIAKVENSWGLTDNDYTIDYETGIVTFNNVLLITDTVRATFHTPASSMYTIEPEVGKRLKVLYVEVQFTADVVMNSDIVFEIYAANPLDPSVQATGSMTTVNAPLTSVQIDIGGVPLIGTSGPRTPGSDDFDMSLGTTAALAVEIAAAINDAANSFSATVVAIPAGSVINLVAGPGAPGPFGNLVTLAVTVDPVGGITLSGPTLTGGLWNQIVIKTERYKRIIDFFQESTGPYPVIPAFGGMGSRGLPSDLVTLPFNYMAYRDMKSLQGVKMVVRLEGDTPMGGYFANATFYCLTETDVL